MYTYIYTQIYIYIYIYAHTDRQTDRQTYTCVCVLLTHVGVPDAAAP